MKNTKAKELEIIGELNKPKIKPKKIIEPKKEEIIKDIIEVNFEPVVYTSKVTYKLNQIGIRRKIQQIGKLKTKILNTEVIEIKIFKIIWDKYYNWFNNKFNDTHFLAIKELDTHTDNTPEIFESDK